MFIFDCRLYFSLPNLAPSPIYTVVANYCKERRNTIVARGDWGWLGQVVLGRCPLVPKESPDGETNDVFGEYVTTAFTSATRIIYVRLASVI